MRYSHGPHVDLALVARGSRCRRWRTPPAARPPRPPWSRACGGRSRAGASGSGRTAPRRPRRCRSAGARSGARRTAGAAAASGRRAGRTGWSWWQWWWSRVMWSRADREAASRTENTVAAGELRSAGSADRPWAPDFGPLAGDSRRSAALQLRCARVLELAIQGGLKTRCPHGRVGSTPTPGTCAPRPTSLSACSSCPRTSPVTGSA